MDSATKRIIGGIAAGALTIATFFFAPSLFAAGIAAGGLKVFALGLAGAVAMGAVYAPSIEQKIKICATNMKSGFQSLKSGFKNLIRRAKALPAKGSIATTAAIGIGCALFGPLGGAIAFGAICMGVGLHRLTHDQLILRDNQKYVLAVINHAWDGSRENYSWENQVGSSFKQAVKSPLPEEAKNQPTKSLSCKA